MCVGFFFSRAIVCVCKGMHVCSKWNTRSHVTPPNQCTCWQRECHLFLAPSGCFMVSRTYSKNASTTAACLKMPVLSGIKLPLSLHKGKAHWSHPPLCFALTAQSCALCTKLTALSAPNFWKSPLRLNAYPLPSTTFCSAIFCLWKTLSKTKTRNGVSICVSRQKSSTIFFFLLKCLLVHRLEKIKQSEKILLVKVTSCCVHGRIFSQFSVHVTREYKHQQLSDAYPPHCLSHACSRTE